MLLTELPDCTVAAFTSPEIQKAEMEINMLKEFALKGNMVDLAIGVIIGGTFSGLVNSIVNDILMPVIGFFTGGIDFTNKVGQPAPQTILAAARQAGATVAYGNFITLLINFLIIAWVLFIVVKGLNMLRRTYRKA